MEVDGSSIHMAINNDQKMVGIFLVTYRFWKTYIWIFIKKKPLQSKPKDSQTVHWSAVVYWAMTNTLTAFVQTVGAFSDSCELSGR